MWTLILNLMLLILFSLVMLSSSRRPSIKVEWYSYYIRHPVTPPLPYTRNLLLAPFLLAMSLHQTANQDDYSCSNNGASYANPGNGRPAELLLFPTIGDHGVVVGSGGSSFFVGVGRSSHSTSVVLTHGNSKSRPSFST